LSHASTAKRRCSRFPALRGYLAIVITVIIIVLQLKCTNATNSSTVGIGSHHTTPYQPTSLTSKASMTIKQLHALIGQILDDKPDTLSQDITHEHLSTSSIIKMLTVFDQPTSVFWRPHEHRSKNRVIFFRRVAKNKAQSGMIQTRVSSSIWYWRRGKCWFLFGTGALGRLCC
jgi:hypothetical protein